MAGFMNDTYMGVPGYGAAIETLENELTWGREESKFRLGIQMSGAARDTTNTPTTFLRRGLILGQIAASPGLFKQYDPAATDGSQVAVAVLSTDLSAVDLAGTNTARLAWALFGGCVKASCLYGLDAVARGQLRGRFWFDDDNAQRYEWYTPQLVEVAKTADYTVVAGDAGTLFTNAGASGAVKFTLPTLAAGLGPFEFLVVADQTVTVAAPGLNDTLVAFNDAAADSIAFSTSGQKIGGRVRVQANQAGTLWYVTNLSQGNTITVAT